ncbi:MAG TPA: Hsp20/alpha crystallin family protein [Planctomycetota bacterium]|nr:Hsp20/alpha crystallin family protein [Planctomycetota bacterium]
MNEQDKTSMERKEEPRPAERTREEMEFVPDADIYETDKELVLVADMPGVDRQSVDVDLSAGVLTITGRARDRKLEDGYACTGREFRSGNFSRSFTLGEEIDSSAIEASMSRGVLRVRLPKAVPASRRIAVKEG